ncbi:MAG: glycosyltransferase family 4 protein [Patescibacteria group bacterium]|nr:glycosyltransferase family 4 protein [Patescibacteria group bacterium]
MKKKILFITKDAALKKLIENNQDPGGRLESLLGYNFLDEGQYEKSLANLPRGEIKGLAGHFWHWLEIPFMKITRLGIALEAYPLLKKQIKNADVIVCVNDGIGFGLCFWKKLGFVKAKLVVIMMGLPEKVKNFRRFPFVRGFISSLLAKAAVVLALSDCAGQSLKDNFRLRPELVKTFRLGTNIDYWRPLPGIEKQNFILSVGNDRNRDFQTLIKALPGNINLKIATKIPVDSRSEMVEILSNVSPGDGLKKLYTQALFAVIPSVRLKEESAGLSSDLQLMASGAAVIISRAQAIEEMFVDGEDCLFYEPENAADLREKIKTLLENKALRDKIAAGGRRKVLENFTCRKMAEQLEQIFDSI